MSDFLVAIAKCSLFSALKSIPHSAAQSAAKFRSFDSIEQIEGGLLPVLYTDVSSANMEKSLEIEHGRSLM